MTKAIIYARFSPRPDADESQSNEKQIERCQEYAAAKGYNVIATFQDKDTSGGDDGTELAPEDILSRRPGLIEALRTMKRGMVLLVRWRSRIARSVYVLEYCRRRCARVSGRIEATDEPNGELPQDKFMSDVFSGLAEMQRMEIKMATSRAMLKHQYEKGRRMTHPDKCPYGWQPDGDDPKRLAEVPAEQATIATIQSLASGGLGLRAICRELDRLGIDRRGKSWHGAHILVKTILERVARANHSSSGKS